MRKYIPKVGTSFNNREELVERLKRSGWKFEGQETYYHSKTGKIIGYNVGVVDEEKGVWLIIELDSLPGGIRVTAIKLRGKKGKRLVKQETYIPILGLDPEVKGLIGDLNEAGYVTEYSCAGHRRNKGFVNFTRTDFTKDELEDIRSIFRQNGIERVTIKVKVNITRATFLGVG